MLSKEEIRKQVLEKRSEIEDAFVTDGSFLIAQNLYGLELYKRAKCVYSYMDFRQ